MVTILKMKQWAISSYSFFYVYIQSHICYNGFEVIEMKKICEISGFEKVRDIYYITKDGQLISYGNYGSAILGKAKKLNQYVKTGDYLNVALMNNDGSVNFHRVSRLVALAFIPNPNNKEYVNHKDENRQNNDVDNLEWVTPKGNNIHSLTKELYLYNSNGDFVKKYQYASECKSDGFNQGHACACARNTENHHKNHVFSYITLNKEDVVQRLSKPVRIKSD